MNPVPAVGVGLLLSQGCLDKFPDPPGFHRYRIITIYWAKRVDAAIKFSMGLEK